MLMIINIAIEYSRTPGARYISDGPFSGEDFRDNFLEKNINNALKIIKN